MDKYKYLLKNVGLLTISNFGTKILSFILIPLYTSVLTTEQYGTYDFYSTTISLLAPVLTLSIVNGVMRFCLDESRDKSQVVTIGLRQEVLAVLIFGLLVLGNTLLHVVPILEEYPVYLFLLFVSLRAYTFFTQFCRGIGRVLDLAIAGIINSVVMFGLNIFLLLYVQMGLEGYFLANIIANILPVIYLLFRLCFWRYIIFAKADGVLKKEMFDYSKPMVLSTLGWWINNASDRYIVTWLCGVATNGIYSVAYKIPSILNILQNVFTQAWALSAIKETDENSGEFYSQTYRVYNCGMVLLCSFLILGDKVMAKILFANEFYVAWQYAPFLMISTVFGAMIGLLEGVFIAAKQTKVLAQTTCIGAAVNTIMNIILVNAIDALGAAIATLISYIVVWVVRWIKVNKLVVLSINIKRDLLAYFLLIVQACALFIETGIITYYLVQLLFLITISNMYLADIKQLVDKIRHRR